MHALAEDFVRVLAIAAAAAAAAAAGWDQTAEVHLFFCSLAIGLEPGYATLDQKHVVVP
jgi:hypothetical protein